MTNLKSVVIIGSEVLQHNLGTSFHFPFQISILGNANFQGIKPVLTKSEAPNDVTFSELSNLHAFLVCRDAAGWCVTLRCRYMHPI